MVCINQMSSYAGHGSYSVDGERENTQLTLKMIGIIMPMPVAKMSNPWIGWALRGIPSTDLVLS